MRKWWILIVAMCLLLIPAVGHAQGPVSLASLDVNLWPEYDAPEMLVIYAFRLPTGTPLPVDVSFRIPAAAGQAFGFGYYPEDGQVPIQENYSQRAEGGWLLVSFTMRTLSGTLEYYDPALLKSGQQRHFEYRWPGDYAVEALRLIVQQPTSAQEVVISPPASSTFTNQNGLLHHLIEAGSQPVGPSYTLTLDYQKEGNDLSVANMPVEATSPLPENAYSPWLTWLGVALALSGTGLLAGGMVWYLTRQRHSKSKTVTRRRKRSSGESVGTMGPTAFSERSSIGTDGVYCHQCGRRAAGGDRFCRACGTQLRVD